MTEYKYIGVSISEVLEGLIEITGSHTESEYLIDEIVREYELEYADAIKIKKGEKTPEQVAEDRENRRLSRKHTDTLRQNMLKAGRIQPPNTSPHHIVAWNDWRADAAQQILKQVGIHIDDEVNGVYLPMYRRHTPHKNMPNAYAHLPVHTTYYYIKITEMLDEERGNKEGVEDVLRDIAKELTDGTFPIHESMERK